MAWKDVDVNKAQTLFETIRGFEAAERLVTKTHSQDGIGYEVSTIRLPDGKYSVYIRVLAVDGKDVSDDRLTANIFGER